MVQMKTRTYADARDRPAVLELLRTARVTAAADRYPTRSRLELLLSSRLYEPARDARIWLDASGTPLGFAALLRRAPDSAAAAPTLLVHPRLAGGRLEEEMLAWCVAWAAESATALEALACEDEPAKRDLLLRHGFAPHASVHNVYLVRPLDNPPEGRPAAPAPSSPPPDGYVVRPLAGAREVDAYDALFSSLRCAAATGSRCCTTPAIHISSSSPLMARSSPSASAPLMRESGHAAVGARAGWTTSARAELRGRGLGRAAFLKGLAWMRRQGAERAALVTMSSNAPALRLYGTAGFREAAKEHVYIRTGVPDEDAAVRT